jgi:hypothetical protein
MQHGPPATTTMTGCPLAMNTSDLTVSGSLMDFKLSMLAVLLRVALEVLICEGHYLRVAGSLALMLAACLVHVDDACAPYCTCMSAHEVWACSLLAAELYCLELWRVGALTRQATVHHLAGLVHRRQHCCLKRVVMQPVAAAGTAESALAVLPGYIARQQLPCCSQCSWSHAGSGKRTGTHSSSHSAG